MTFVHLLSSGRADVRTAAGPSAIVCSMECATSYNVSSTSTLQQHFPANGGGFVMSQRSGSGQSLIRQQRKSRVVGTDAKKGFVQTHRDNQVGVSDGVG